MRFIDVTDSPDARVDYPEIVQEFLDMGFARIGRAVVEPVEGTMHDIAKDYTPADREAFLEHCDVPTPILQAPDGSALVDISWFWGGPAVRLRSVLQDGSLVETNRRWTNAPSLPRGLRFVWRNTDIDHEMTRTSVPEHGRSVEVPFGTSVATQWQRHQAHTARYSAQRGSAVVHRHDLESYITLATNAVRHDTLVMERTTARWMKMVVAYGVAAIITVLGLTLLGAAGTAITVALAFALLAPVVVYLVASQMRWLPESRRPPYV